MLHSWHKLCCFQPKTLILALFWVNRGDILGNEIFDFGLMHRKSSCLFIISLECFCLWIWNIKMAIVQTNERTYPCHFQTFELRPSTRVYVRRKFERRDGISGTFLYQHMICYIEAIFCLFTLENRFWRKIKYCSVPDFRWYLNSKRVISRLLGFSRLKKIPLWANFSRLVSN